MTFDGLDIRALLRGRRYISAEARFALSYIPEPNSGCWLWLGHPRGSNGYGGISVNGQSMGAHRFSWTQHRGPIPPGMFVLHRCDTPLCVNPDHLFLGSHADNEADKMRKGRQARGVRLRLAQAKNRARGERGGNAVLSAAQVARIREDTRSQRAIAHEYEVSQATIWHIKNRRTWND